MSFTAILTVIERIVPIAIVAYEAAKRGDLKSVDEILPAPDSYPDDHAFNRIREQADRDYGPRP